jgi:hypothetical protein
MNTSNAHRLKNLISISDSRDEFESYLDEFFPHFLFSSNYLEDVTSTTETIHAMKDGSCFIKYNNEFVVLSYPEVEDFSRRESGKNPQFLLNLAETLVKMAQETREKYAENKELLTNEEKKSIFLEIFDHFSCHRDNNS